ncbi:NAD(P)H-binding protein [Rhodococcoides yunnanense]|uniref:NAD(P)H-binding protein n=1 Tax=Rhodococcoides yunnanense TaxID=278209 RepID=UPI000932EA64|nr:NAD(P)H-binding protein [Rhodococcus yunnanensis]
MTRIVEFSPVFAEATNSSFHHVQGIWNAREHAERQAAERGHTYSSPEQGGVSQAAATELLSTADALVLAPTVAAPTGMWQPTDGEEAGRLIGHRLLDVLSSQRPDLHIVLVSHFLVGHGATHKNSKPSTWGLRALEAHLRGGDNPWTILRPTWFSTIHDPAYQTRLTGDRNADGLVSAESVADAVLTAIENPHAAAGRTAAVYNLAIPDVPRTALVAQFENLDRDVEALVGQR